MEGCLCSWGVDGMGLAVDKSLLGWLCHLRNKTVDPHQVKLALPMYWKVGLCLMPGGGGEGGLPEVTECAGGGMGGYWSDGMSLSASALGEGACGGWETGAMPCARVPETRLSTPPPAPGRPPAAATLIRPGGNL